MNQNDMATPTRECMVEAMRLEDMLSLEEAALMACGFAGDVEVRDWLEAVGVSRAVEAACELDDMREKITRAAKAGELANATLTAQDGSWRVVGILPQHLTAWAEAQR